MTQRRRPFWRLFWLLLIGALGAASLLFWALRADLFPRTPPPPPAPLHEQIDHILIEKSARRLSVFKKGEKLREYEIALGFTPQGNKTVEGDGKTPEGLFRIDRRNPNSAFHLSLGIDYPQPDDIARAQAAGTSPGGDIFIHGQPNKVGNLITLPGDWTAGCIALSNAEMQELWRITPTGTAVEIRP